MRASLESKFNFCQKNDHLRGYESFVTFFTETENATSFIDGSDWNFGVGFGRP